MDYSLEMKKPSRRLALQAVVDGWCPSFPPESTLIVGIGTVGRVGHNSTESTGNQQITCIKGNELVLPRFLSWQLWARSEEVREIAPYTTLPILNNEFLLSLPIFVPALDSQRRHRRSTRSDCESYRYGSSTPATADSTLGRASTSLSHGSGYRRNADANGGSIDFVIKENRFLRNPRALKLTLQPIEFITHEGCSE